MTSCRYGVCACVLYIVSLISCIEIKDQGHLSWRASLAETAVAAVRRRYTYMYMYIAHVHVQCVCTCTPCTRLHTQYVHVHVHLSKCVQCINTWHSKVVHAHNCMCDTLVHMYMYSIYIHVHCIGLIYTYLQTVSWYTCTCIYNTMYMYMSSFWE